MIKSVPHNGYKPRLIHIEESGRILFLVLFLLLMAVCSSASAVDTFLCTRAVDGDTIKLEKGETVRLIGVDTPESVHPLKPVEYFAIEAKNFTQSLVVGRYVRLEYDQTLRDKYDRLLAYVYLDDGTFVNAEIIKQGYGFAYTKYPFKYIDEFREYEKAAREGKKGLWK